MVDLSNFPIIVNSNISTDRETDNENRLIQIYDDDKPGDIPWSIDNISPFPFSIIPCNFMVCFMSRDHCLNKKLKQPNRHHNSSVPVIQRMANFLPFRTAVIATSLSILLFQFQLACPTLIPTDYSFEKHQHLADNLSFSLGNDTHGKHDDDGVQSLFPSEFFKPEKSSQARGETANITSREECDSSCCIPLLREIAPDEMSGIFHQVASLDLVSSQKSQLRGNNVERVARRLQSTSSNNHNPCPPEPSTSQNGNNEGIPLAVQYILIVILVFFSALFSGLTLGLMSLDPSGLEIVMANADDPGLASAAKAIYPVRQNGNLLLCTLLLGNVGVNSLLSIFMADLTSGLVGFLVSTCVIVLFGEIIPQAVCSRYALQVGKRTIPIVKVIMFLLYPVTKPLSFILDKVLGHEIGTTYSTSEMAKLIEMHVQRGHFEGDTGAAMTGALRYRNIPVSEAMTPIVNVFMLSADERLGFDTVAKIFKTGYSRIPVYEVSKSNVIGLLFVKDLIFLDPEDEIPVKNFVQIFGRGLHVVWPDDKLGEVLKLLKSGRSHMALVRDVNHNDGTMDPYYEIKGIITLEDIIEIILGDEIVDETDEFVNVNDPASLVRRSEVGDYIEGALERAGGGVAAGRPARGVDWEARLRLLDERLVDEHLSADEVRAVAAHLKTNYSKAVELVSDRQLKELISSVPVTEISPALTCSTAEGDDAGNGVPTDSAELLYERGVSTDFCTVVLSGKITIMSGADKFRSDVSNWGVLASRALVDATYVPDFTAWVVPNPNGTGGCRCVKLDRRSYFGAVDNTALEKTGHTNVMLVESSDIMRHNSINCKLHVPGDQDEDGIKVCQTECPLPSSNTFLCPPEGTEGATKDKLPTQIPVSIVDNPSHTSYIAPESQEAKQSRRGKLMKAFRRAAGKKEFH